MTLEEATKHLRGKRRAALAYAYENNALDFCSLPDVVFCRFDGEWHCGVVEDADKAFRRGGAYVYWDTGKVGFVESDAHTHWPRNLESVAAIIAGESTL
jgi:hypothetical protein